MPNLPDQPPRSPAADRLASWSDAHPETKVPGYWEALASNCAQWADDASVCPFWKEFERQRQQWSTEFYSVSRGGSLLARDELPRFCGKGRDRIKSKLLEMDPPEAEKILRSDGPPVPDLNDLVRTRVECSYLDGIEFLGDKIEQAAKDAGVSIVRERKGRIEGYFAQHLTFYHWDYFRFGGSNEPVSIRCEIQLATRLATTIWNQSHHVYEAWRGREESSEDWQWNPQDPRFIARQLGHMIHLADGLLVQLRDAQFEGRIENVKTH